MKKILFILTATIASSSSMAQNTFPPNGNVGIGVENPVNGLHIFSHNNFENGSLRFGYSGSDDAVLSFGWNGTDQDVLKISKFPHNSISNGTTFLAIKSTNGNVGIGTVTPDAKLSVNGSIHAREVKVDMHSWPDYVFKPSYKLLPLAEMKKYIGENLRLPGMPSEQEVGESGVNLGEMVKLQTRKIEELTLYLIEKDEQVAKQEILLREQKEEIDRLKKLEERIKLLEDKITKNNSRCK